MTKGVTSKGRMLRSRFGASPFILSQETMFAAGDDTSPAQNTAADFTYRRSRERGVEQRAGRAAMAC